MNGALARLKLSAYLHDPAHKALVLFHGEGHERVAEGVRATLALQVASGDEERVRQADHIAAACDRPNFPPDTPSVDFLERPKLTHPLVGGGRAFDLGGLAGLDLGELTRGVGRAVHALAQALGGDLERVYLALWRYFAELLRRGEQEAGLPEPNRLGLLWYALPADTRVPDHTIWDHLAVTAAVVGALPRPAFLVFSVGPVQGFIAQARTTRDLWMGSYLLSFLAWEAMRPICEALGPDAILYPSLREQPLVDAWLQEKGVVLPWQTEGEPYRRRVRMVAGLPNKFVALVPEGEAEHLAGEAVRSLKEAWRRVAGEARAFLKERGVDVHDGAWNRQLEGQFETFWVVLPWPEAPAQGEAFQQGWEELKRWLTEDGLSRFGGLEASAKAGRYPPNAGLLYAPLHGMAQRAFDAAKLARPFGPVEEPGYKCTLCGERSPVLAGDADYPTQVREWEKAASAFQGLLRPEGRERLCAVCLVKRLSAERGPLREAVRGRPRFPSTSTLAALPVLKALQEKASDLRQSLESFLEACREAAEALRQAGRDVVFPEWEEGKSVEKRLEGLDGEWLFEETYARWRRELRGRRERAEEALRRAEEALRRLREESREKDVDLPKPSPFYAILLMDGDHMGRWVSGQGHKSRLRDILHPDVAEALVTDDEWRKALDESRPFGPSTHGALSGALSAFARFTVPYLVEERGYGNVVYAGGDDVLALLPLPSALAVALALREAYRQPFVLVERDGGRVAWERERLPKDLKRWRLERHMGPDATTSGALAFVHHLYPLGPALEQVRRWEREAKDVYGRNALVVGIVRRSGPDVAVGGPWSLAEALIDLARAFAQRKLPGRTPYLMRGPAFGAMGLSPEARKALALAVLKEREAEVPTELVQLVEDMGEAMGWDLGRLADMLMAARFLGQEAGIQVRSPSDIKGGS